MPKRREDNEDLEYVVSTYSEVPDSPPSYLWYPYIPFGMITTVQGMPGSGKSTLMTDIIAAVTTGRALPDGSKLKEKITAIYQCSEAGGTGVIKAMLRNSGADLDSVYFLKADTLTMLDGRIRKVIEETNAKLLVIDPMQEFLDSNMNQAQPSRKEFSNIARLAEETGCAIILLGHFTKSDSKEEIYQGMGSADISAVARSMLHVRRLQDRSSRIRYLSQVKCNLAIEGGDYAFEIVDLGVVSWIGPVDRSEMDEINEESKSKRGEKQESAINDLRRLLENEDLESKDVMEKMKKLGHSEGTVKLIKTAAGVKSIKMSNGPWVWHLM